MATSPPPKEENPFAGCPACGAERHPQARFCWLCGAPQSVAMDAPVVAELVEPKPPSWTDEHNPWVLHASIWAGTILAFVVGYGVIAADDRTLAGVYLIAVVPALLFTIFGSTLARLAGRPWDPGKKVLAFTSVFGITVAVSMIVMVLIVVSAIIAFFQMCFGGGR